MVSLSSVWSRLVSGALDYQLPDGLVDPRGGSPCWLSACHDEPSRPCNSCEGLIELSLNRYRLWLLVEAWSSLPWHLFTQWPGGLGTVAYIVFVEKLVRTWKALVGEAQRKHRRLGLDGVSCFCRHLAPWFIYPAEPALWFQKLCQGSSGSSVG